MKSALCSDSRDKCIDTEYLFCYDDSLKRAEDIMYCRSICYSITTRSFNAGDVMSGVFCSMLTEELV